MSLEAAIAAEVAKALAAQARAPSPEDWVREREGLAHADWPPAPGIYFVRCGDRIKIGQAINVRGRVRRIQTCSPYPIDLLLVLLCPIQELDDDEAELHERFAEHRRHGEWFDAAPVLAFIQQERAKP